MLADPHLELTKVVVMPTIFVSRVSMQEISATPASKPLSPSDPV